MKKIVLLVLIFFIIQSQSKGQVVVTKGTFPTLCNGVATYYNQLTDIIITETHVGDVGAIAGPSSFNIQTVPFTQLNTSAGQIQIAVNGDITSATISVGTQNFFITYNCNSITKLDTIIIKGLQLRTIGGAPASFDYNKQTNTGGTQTGFVIGQSVMTVNTNNNFADFTLPAPSSFCSDTPPYLLVGNPTGGTFSGTGVIGNYLYPSLITPGTFTSITYATGNACSSSITKTASVPPNPILTSNKDSICQGQSIMFTALGGAIFTFYKNNSVVQGPGTNNKYTTTQLAQGDEIHVTITNNGCLLSSDTLLIPVNAIPVVNFTISDYCAVKFPNTFTSTATIPYGISTVSNTQWYIDISGTSSYYPSGNTINHKFLTAGTHTVRSIVTLANGCSNQKDSTIFMGDYPKAKFSWQTACGTSIVDLNDSSYVQQIGSSINQWSWDYENDNTYNQVGTISDHSYDYSSFGNYFIKLKVATNYGCTDSVSTKVSLQPTVTPTATVPYIEEFKLNDGSWTHLGDSSTWNWGAAYGNALGTGSRTMWSTGSIDGQYKNGEVSYLQSPCVNMSGLDKPMMSIKLWSKTENNNAGAMLEASTDGGVNWRFVGKVGLGVKWYDNAGVSGIANIPPAQNHPNNEGWTGTYPDWRIAKISLDEFAGNPTVKFRISFGAVTGNSPKTFGFAIDSVWIGNRTKRVVLEHFTNTRATPALTEASTAVNLIRDSRKNDVSAVYYHCSFPSTDGYNQFYPAGPNSRVLYYGVPNAPRTILDGNVYDGSVYTTVAGIDTNDIDSRILETAQFRLDMSTYFDPGQLTAAVKIIYTNPYTTYNRDVVLHTIVVEDTADGNNQYSSVVRQMLPDAAGNYISKPWQLNDNYTVTSAWNYTGFANSKLGVVAYIQDHISKEILQSVYVRGEGSSGSVVIASNRESRKNEAEVLVYPNPADNELTLLAISDTESIANWILYDNLGEEIKSGNSNKSVKGVTINTADLTNGLYYIKGQLSGGTLVIKKIIVAH